MKPRLAFLVVIGGLAATGPLLAQDTTLLPEIRRELAIATDDTARAEALARICFNLIQSDPDSARWYGDMALALAQRTGNPKALGDAWNNLGWLDAQYGRLDSAQARLERALVLFKRVGNPGYASVSLSNMGWLANKRGDRVGALRHFQAALKQSESVQDSASTSILLYSIGTTYRQMGDFKVAMAYMGKALAMERALGRPSKVAACLMGIANIALEQGDTAKALAHYEQAYPLSVAQGDLLGAGLAQENMGNLYLGNRPTLALDHYTKALKFYREAGSDADMAYLLLGMAQAKQGQGRLAEARSDLVQGRTLAIATGSTALVMDYEKAMGELAGQLGDGPGAVAHFQRYVHLKDSLQGADTQRELARLRTAFETERKEKDNQLLRAENRAQQERIRQRNIQLYGLVALAVLALLAALLFRRNYRQKRRHAEVLEGLNRRLEASNAEISEINALLESRLLRSQMNPHFIYNALGSAVDLTDAGRTAEAADYLRGFARLLRMVLDHSVDDTVGVEDEMEFLRQYLRLEAVRMPGLAWSVEAEQALLEEDAAVPALIVQPFVENALLHGLAPKGNDRKLEVHFAQADGQVACTITDNGVGRAFGRSGSGTAGHRSLGMQLTQERVRLLARRMGGPEHIRVEDLTGPDGAPAGTRVVLQLIPGTPRAS